MSNSLNDPVLYMQWHRGAIDLPALNAEFSGSGVAVGIYDDGIEATHAELAANYDASKEITLSNGTRLVAQGEPGEQKHGTAVAGIIAAAGNNRIGGAGIAHNAKITSVDIISGPGSGYTTEAMGQMDRFDVVNHSWGWLRKYSGNHDTESSSGTIFNDTLEAASDNGRNGLGTVIVNSASNDWDTMARDANTSGFSASRFSITVGAVGDDGDRAGYSNPGANLLVGAPSRGGIQRIWTTDETGAAGFVSGDHTPGFGGTSAAAPMVTGVVALMLEANRDLGWRDVQQILAISSDLTKGDWEGSGTIRVDPSDGLTKEEAALQTDLWAWNGASNWNGGGMHFSNDVGFGLLDAFEAVRLAETWSLFGTAKTSANEISTTVSDGTDKAIPNGTGGAVTLRLNVTTDIALDYASLTLNLTHGNVEDLRVVLTSPDGTQSLVLTPGSSTQINAFTQRTWHYGSNEFRGEFSAGTWTVTITDTRRNDTSGTVLDVGLSLYGSEKSINSVYHFTDEFMAALAIDPTRSVIVDRDGGTDWLNFAALKGAVTANLSAMSVVLTGVSTLTIAAATLIENVVTGDGADSLFGNLAANVFHGMRGDDTLTGGVGNDTLDGGAGTDTAVFTGNRSDYTVSAAGGVTTITDRTAGRDGTDVVKLVERFTFADGTVLASDLVPGSGGSGTGGANRVLGTEGNDALSGSSGVDDMKGNGGNDTLNGSAGSDSLTGGAGFDTASYGASGAAVTVDLASAAAQIGGDAAGDVLVGMEAVVGSAYADRLSGDASANRLDGGRGDDTLNGGNGDDTLAGGLGNDTLDGGAGTDTAVFTGNRSDYTVSAAGGVTTITDRTAGRDGTDAVKLVERFTFADGTVLASDLLTGSGGSGTGGSNQVLGTEGNDTLSGSSGVDDMKGNGGNDTLNGSAGSDSLTGGAGFDTASYGASGAAVTVDLSSAAAQIGGDAAGDVLVGMEAVVGSAYADRLSGDASANRLDGGRGDDTVSGGNGDDTLTGGLGNDTIDGGGDRDTAVFTGNRSDYAVRFVNGTITLADQTPGRDGTDVVKYIERFTFADGTVTALELLNGSGGSGTGGTNQVLGTEGNDTLSGSSGVDDMKGNGGNDTLNGSAGSDSLTGGAGFDTASYGASGAAVTVDLASAVAQIGGDAAGDILLGLEAVVGSAHADRLSGDASTNRLDGGRGNDTLQGRRGDDTLTGGGGDDTIDGGAGTDTVVFTGNRSEYGVRFFNGVTTIFDRTAGRDGTDVMTYVERITFADGTVLASEFRSTNGGSATGGALQVLGTEGADTLSGSRSVDNMKGNGGNDTLNGSAGSDSLTGGAGFDTASYGASGAAVTVDLASAAAQIGGDAAGDVLVGMEAVVGSLYADRLSGDASANRLGGGRGNDTVSGRGGDDTLTGGLGNDTIDGGVGTDTAVFTGNRSDYAVRFVNGTITLADQTPGRDGGDIVKYVERFTFADGTVTALELLNGTEGAGSGRARQVLGTDGNDTLTGSGGTDDLKGNGGNDLLVDGLGRDILRGGGGNDKLVWLGGVADLLDGGSGRDTLDLTRLTSAADVDFATKAAGSDGSWASLASIEVAIGTRFNDRFVGSQAAEQFEGRSGKDLFTGGGGADRFVFGRDDGNDRIKDFARGVDKLVMKGMAYSDLKLTDLGADVVVSYAGGAVKLTGVETLAQSDFLFI